jgi:hypothetical protein
MVPFIYQMSTGHKHHFHYSPLVMVNMIFALIFNGACGACINACYLCKISITVH